MYGDVRDAPGHQRRSDRAHFQTRERALVEAGCFIRAMRDGRHEKEGEQAGGHGEVLHAGSHDRCLPVLSGRAC